MLNPKPVLTITRRPEIADSRSYFENYGRVVAELPYARIEQVADALYRAYQQERRVFLFGNGGSAALASHFACDLGKGTTAPGNHHKRFRVLSLTDNIPLITAWANDLSYDQVFAEQLRNFIQPGDIAFGISGSGCSPNVLLALQAARESNAFNIGLTGFSGGKMPGLCDICVIIPSHNMQIIEDFQLSITHALFTMVRHRINEAGRDAAWVQEPGCIHAVNAVGSRGQNDFPTAQ
jgi:D-sedoheptulose 7-phosphate isomerase